MAEKLLDSQGYLKKILLARIYDLVKVTPLQKLENLSSRLGVNVLLKREDYQKIHSFKLRGAYHKIKNLDENQLKAGIVTASAGNHAQGVALSAKKLGIKAVIVMPTTTPDLKIDAVRNFGAEVVLYGDSFNESYDYAQQLSKKKGLTMIPPYDDQDVIAGQGTIAHELIGQCDSIDTIFVQIGGGGLAAGIAVMKELASGEVNKALWEKGRYLQDNFRQLAKDVDVPIDLQGYPVRMSLFYTDYNGKKDWLYNSIFMQECVKRGVLLGWHIFPCYSHTKEDLDYTLNVFEDAMKVYKKALKSGNPSSYMEGTPLKIVLG